MPAEFQQKKLGYFFKILDLNSNGQLQMDDFTEMGRYLRALGVPEMIALVGRVRDCMEDTGGPAALGLDFPPPHGLRRH